MTKSFHFMNRRPLSTRPGCCGSRSVKICQALLGRATMCQLGMATLWHSSPRASTNSLSNDMNLFVPWDTCKKTQDYRDVQWDHDSWCLVFMNHFTFPNSCMMQSSVGSKCFEHLWTVQKYADCKSLLYSLWCCALVGTVQTCRNSI